MLAASDPEKLELWTNELWVIYINLPLFASFIWLCQLPSSLPQLNTGIYLQNNYFFIF